MSVDWKDRIAGIKRIALALGVMALCAVASLQYKALNGTGGPGIFQTKNAQTASCSLKDAGGTFAMFNCAVKTSRAKVSSIQFLSAERSGKESGSWFKHP
ncbi:hypothetical protein [Pseudorhodobacter sp.]|uniref:hypothetical protein n=1 Tax=Pseudorhodobacter sp. TaxID=1934400 RepID=UPI002649BCCE|nr:hypothetical protein [Pseudorhodobacter sp.]MDN5785773.1 hypothetical protein [Pseudorhodobacter sp.]